MSSTSSRTSANDSTSSSAFRVNYSEYVADITGSPKTARKLPSGIGQHINPIHNPYPNRSNQPTQQPTAGMPQYGGGAEKCARCAKSVYLAEKKVGAGRSFHSICFNCLTCKRKLDATNLTEHKGEIYCKPCYTKQFGAHGLISGVTMSTEHTSTHDSRYTRRPSYGNDLDAATGGFQQIRQRTNSSENVFRDDYGSRSNDQFAQKYPRTSDTSREGTSPSNQRKNSVDILVDSKYRRSPSPTGGVQIPIQTSTSSNQQRSNYGEDNDRRKYSYDGDKIAYGSGASALVEIPVVVQTKRSDSTIDRIDMPLNPTRDNQRSRSPSITSNDSSQRQGNLSDDYPRFSAIDDRSTRRSSTDNALNAITSTDPTSSRNYYHSSSSSSYQNQYRSTTSNANNYSTDQFRSRESSPSTAIGHNRSPSPVGGYTSSSTTTRTQRVVDTSRGSTAGYAPQHDYTNTQTSSSVIGRRSPSPSSNTRPISGLNEFVSKTNIVGNASSTGNQFSALGALLPNARRRVDDDDDDFDN